MRHCLGGLLRWANDQAQPNRTPRGQREQQMTT